MRAAVFKAIGEALVIVDLPDPEPAADEVIISVGRCGICGSDLHMTEAGGAPPPPGSVIGHEIAGEIVAIGKNVGNLNIGDRVAALPIKGCGKCLSCKAGEPSWCEAGMQFLGGGYAQFARAGAAECLILPADLNAADGALVEPLAVSLHGARMATNIKGATVTVIGAGPIGLGAVFWARRMGATSIQVVESNAFRGELALGMGADKLFSPPAPDAEAASLPAAADVVFECVGKPGLLLVALDRVKPRGTVISLGFCMGPENFVAAAAAMREATLKFPILYTIDDYRTTLAALEGGALEPRAMITETVNLAQLPETFELLRKPGHQCKVMIDPWQQ